MPLSWMTFLARPSRFVRSSWISPLHSKFEPRYSFHRHAPLSRFLSSSQKPSRLSLAHWQVGDSVELRIMGNVETGFIQEDRGGGWYTIQLMGTKNTIKCRGTRLKPSPSSTASITSVLDGTTTTLTSNGPSFDIEPGSKPEHPPPPPTIHDLDEAVKQIDFVSNPRDREFLQQVAHHSSFETWVTFTDLHCSPSSLESCLQVMTAVHDLAVSRNAGVLFLGDFWHHRGTLRVDCLNAVLEHLRTWTVPMVLIPGNHDQVTLGGHNHGLTPLENAYRVGSVPGPLVFSYPTKFRNALFVPHIRDIATMESILQSPVSQDEVSAIFVHADVTGAYMNDLIISQGGIPPAAFPPRKRVYSGHFHKPHTVRSGGVTVEYLGSPYETSLAEAHQPKSLAILDLNWQCIEYVPMDIGRKHFKVSTWQDLLRLRISNSSGDASTSAHHSNTDTIKAGDRIVVTIPKEQADNVQPAVRNHIKELRRAGATVEIREVKQEPLDAMGIGGAGSASELEDMTPESTWKAFLKEAVGREAMSNTKQEALLQAGLDLIEEVVSNDENPITESASVMDLQLTSVTLEGFGPFRESINYPLLNRGLVLLRGTNRDGGSDR